VKKNQHISIKNDLAEITSVLDFCSLYGEQMKVGAAIYNRMNIVLDELISNIIKYGYSDTKEHLISISFSVDKIFFSIKILYDGINFDPVNAEYKPLEKEVEDMHIGGQGIKIVKKLTDIFEYKRDGNKNYLTVKKKLQV